MNERTVLVINPKDNVAIALRDLEKGEIVAVEGHEPPVEIIEKVPLSHKVALVDIPNGEPVLKYGEEIGRAARNIKRGEWVHAHNIDGSAGYQETLKDALAKPR